MFERKDGAGNEWLAEFVSEVACTVGSLDKNLFRCLVQPLSDGQDVLPFASAMNAGVCRDIHRGSRNGPGAHSATHSIPDFTSGAGGRAVERFDGGREIVCLRLQGDDAFYVLDDKIIACGLVFRRELFNDRTLCKGDIVLVSGNDVVRMFFSGFLYHLEQRRGHLFSVDDECATEDFVAAMFRVDLSESEHFRVGQFSSQLFFHSVEIGDFLLAQREPFLFVFFLDVFYGAYRFRFSRSLENLLVKSFVETLQHGIVFHIFVFHGKIFFNALKPLYVHVLCDFHGVGTPRGDHFAARTNKETIQGCFR